MTRFGRAEKPRSRGFPVFLRLPLRGRGRRLARRAICRAARVSAHQAATCRVSCPRRRRRRSPEAARACWGYRARVVVLTARENLDSLGVFRTDSVFHTRRTSVSCRVTGSGLVFFPPRHIPSHRAARAKTVERRNCRENAPRRPTPSSYASSHASRLLLFRSLNIATSALEGPGPADRRRREGFRSRSASPSPSSAASSSASFGRARGRPTTRFSVASAPPAIGADDHIADGSIGSAARVVCFAAFVPR